MPVPKIGIIMGSNRPTRFADKPTQWLFELAQERQDLAFEVVDLRDYPLPFFEEVASNSRVPSKGEVAQRWQKKLTEFDGFIFVTGEYNHSIPAVLKNALDYAYPEWNRKPAAFFGYGAVGAARGIQHLKDICIELQMVPLRHAVHLQGADFMGVMRGGLQLADIAYLAPLATDMLDQLSWWAAALKGARQ